MFVHMLIPFARSSKGFRLVATGIVSTDDFAILISRWLALRTS